MNFTKDGINENKNNVVTFNSSSVASIYKQEFNQMYNKNFGDDKNSLTENYVEINGIPTSIVFT
ncbi:MAG: hypothetical protein ABEJ65_11305, partial [bacterium]